MSKFENASWGIILIKNLTNIPITHTKTNLNDFNQEIEIQNRMQILDLSEKINFIRNNLFFLLVQRNHSIGYVNFIKGSYEPDNYITVGNLFKQMTSDEIKYLQTNIDDFDTIWKTCWNDNNTSTRNYTISKNKFKKLRDNKNELSLESFFKIKPLYDFLEWGYPKGRKLRNKPESDKECAIREFCEETGLTETDIKIIDEIEPIIEIMTGTDGRQYVHTYYVAESITDKKPITTSNEINDVDFFTVDQADRIIRDYHIEKKKILSSLFKYYTNKFLGL